jgi:lipoprotein-releasing system permease protein
MKKDTGTSFFIALRYLFSPKKHNIINIISVISALGIMASTAALVVVLSVFNGMQDLVVSNFNRCNPPLKIEAKEGKVFSISDLKFDICDLEKVKGVKAVEQVVSDLVLVTYNEKQTLATLYGISESYPELSGLSAMIIDGNFDAGSKNGIAFGAGVAVLLGIDLNEFEPVKLYYPKRNKKNFANPMEAFQTCYARPAGVFASFITSYDENTLFASEKIVKELFDYETEISFIAIYLDENAKLEKVQKEVTQMVGNDFTVQNQMQQETLLFKTIQTENLVVYLILGFILIIATFNIMGILWMMIIEKKQDISILHTLGASKALLKKIFLIVGAMLGTFGGFLGMCIGLVCCLIQQYFGVISLGGANSSYIITAYPVSISAIDFVVVGFLVIGISLLSSWVSLRGLKNNYLINKY